MKVSPRVWSMVVAFLLVALGTLVSAGSAGAADSAPPAPQDKRVLGAVHTDAVAGFVDDGQLVIDTMADVDGELGKRFDTDSLIFNLAGGQTPVPAGASWAFLGDEGDEIWLAPQTQDHSLIWPGFSTQAPSLIQAIGADGVVGVEMSGFEGPKDSSFLEVFTIGSFGDVDRIFSSKDDLTSWSRLANQHTHVNWGFSDPGKYVLTFTLSATVNGTPQTATQDFVFFVGDVADYPTVDTSVEVQVAPEAPAPDEDITMSGTVAPAGADGYLQFFDGDTSLGWKPVENGSAELTGVRLDAGEHSLTARFTPRWTQEFAPSTSPVRTITVDSPAVTNTSAPVLSGIPSAGQSLSVTPGSWEPAPDDVAYQWLRDGDPVEGATGDSYLVVAGDTGHEISARVTATKAGYTPGITTTEAVRVDALSNTAKPTITGEPVAGGELTAGPGSWTPDPDSFDHQWLRDGDPISGATGTSYIVDAGDAGHDIAVRVTALKDGFDPVSATSASVTIGAKQFASVSDPTISGTWTVGKKLTASDPASVPTADSYHHQWLRDGDPISGATGTSYTIRAADVDHNVSVRVTATKSGYAGASATATAQKVTAAPIEVTTAPVISGTPAVGQTLSVSDGSWDPEPDSVAVQWLRDGDPISSATSSSYQVKIGDVGHTISARVTAKADGFTSTTVTTDGAAVPLAEFSSVSVSIDGSGKVGQKLTAQPNSAPSADEFTFQWSRNGDQIDGATAVTYTPKAADLGANLTVRATVTAPGYASATSAPSDPVTIAEGTLSADPEPGITGARSVGGVLRVSEGAWNTPVTLSQYQWLRDGDPIDGADATTYQPQVADAGATLTVTVKATADGYTSTTVTTAGAVIDGKPLVDPPAPLEADELTEDNEGGLGVDQDGNVATITFADGTVDNGDWVHVYGYSTPTSLGWYQVAQGVITVDVSSLGAGAHKLAVHPLSGDLLGWVPVTVSANAGSDDGASDAGGNGGNSGGSDGRGLPDTGAGRFDWRFAALGVVLIACGTRLVSPRRRLHRSR